jgi:Mn2+/Fe2+ NRAMP family transporter
MLPFVLIFMLFLINKTELMAEYTNSRTFNWIASATVGIMIIMTGIFVVTLFL